MDEVALETLIRAKYSGSLTEMNTYLNLAIQAAAVVFGGIVLWRISVIMHKRKLAKRGRKEFFETPYSRGWKRR